MENNITVTFFGTRGSTPVSGKEYMEYGGNTTCIALETDSRLTVLDCGTGMQSLQKEYFEGKGYKEADIFISHIHWDHVQGIPFFSPFFNKECRFRLYGECRKGMTFQEQIESILTSPMFPVKAEALLADMGYRDVECGRTIETPFYSVDTVRLNHPNICTGYCFHIAGKKICSIIDCENAGEEIHRFAMDSDLLMLDAQYTDEEYPAKRGWGHSSYESCLSFARECRAKKAALVHHDPFRNDRMLKELQETAEEILPGTVFAYDGMKLML